MQRNGKSYRGLSSYQLAYRKDKRLNVNVLSLTFFNPNVSSTKRSAGPRTMKKLMLELLKTLNSHFRPPTIRVVRLSGRQKIWLKKRNIFSVNGNYIETWLSFPCCHSKLTLGERKIMSHRLLIETYIVKIKAFIKITSIKLFKSWKLQVKGYKRSIPKSGALPDDGHHEAPKNILAVHLTQCFLRAALVITCWK